MHPAPVKASAWVRERFPHEVPKRGVPAPAVLGVWMEQFHFSGGSADVREVGPGGVRQPGTVISSRIGSLRESGEP